MKRIVLSLLLCFVIMSATNVMRQDDVILYSNDYVALNCRAQPMVKKDAISNINIADLVDVTAFGAVGNGTHIDDAGIDAAFASWKNTPAKKGIYFPPGKTFLISTVLTYDKLDKDLTVVAYGATIKMAPLGKHSMIAMDYIPYQQTHTFLWLGGTFDGDKFNQKWDGNPHGGIYDDTVTKVENHGRALGISAAKFGMFYQVHFKNIVMDGVALESCKLGVIAECTSTAAANLEWYITGQQGTCFKGRNYQQTFGNGNTSYFINDTVFDGGAMGIQMSYPQNVPYMDSSITAILYNCVVRNAKQNGIHFEDCANIILDNVVVDEDQISDNDHIEHFSSKSYFILIKNSYFRNCQLNGSNAQHMKQGTVRDCRFVSDYPTNSASPTLTFVHNFNHMSNCTLIGPTKTEQAQVDYIRQCTFQDFGNQKACIGVITADSCTFINGTTTALSFNSQLNGKCYFGNFINAGTNQNSTPTNNNYLSDFRTAMDMYEKDKNGVLTYLVTYSAGL